MKKPVIYFMGLLAFSMNAALAYEAITHEEMSERAFDVSVLKKDNKVLQNLGLKSLEEKEEFPNSKGNKKTVAQLFRDGANFEDNNIRPLFHFFDPLNDEGLFFFTSPTWALEDKGKIHLLQNYSFSDARSAFYDALTATSEDKRKTEFGKTFESLGHVIHHIQDMAQPQHVRLDPHLNLSWTEEELPFENRSRYEKYTKDNPDKLTPLFNRYPPVNSTIDSNFLTTARSFWHTEARNPKDGKGLAEFTNSNFVSVGTNFDTDRYEFPKLSEAVPHNENANDLLESVGITPPTGCLPPNPPCAMTFYSTAVKDKYRPAADAVNPRASTESIFDQDLKAKNLKPAFTLNRFNFDAAHEFLIPRAVAYSAGLIDYFFRGKLEAEDAEFTDTGIRLRVKNATNAQATPAWANETLYAANTAGTRGTFVIAFEYKDTTGTTRYGASEPVPAKTTAEGGGDLVPGATSTALYDFTVSLPADARQVKYRLVFRGKLGKEEDTVAVGNADPASGFVFTPSYTPTDGISGSRVIFNAGGKWLLSDQPGKVAGNVDWKGWYVNGRPTKVLSWSGPAARSLPDPPGTHPFDVNIYQDGVVYAVAPCPILGTALTKDSRGQEWIVAVCKSGNADIVYRRPNILSASAVLYHPIEAPEGWQQIGNFDHDSSEFFEADRPWFFNGAGTEAQTMRLSSSWDRVFRLRIQLSPSAAEASFSNEDSPPGITIVNIRTSVCDETGISDTFTTKSSGQFYLAVDYQDDKLIFATFSMSENSKSAWSSGNETVEMVEIGFTTTISIPGARDLVDSTTLIQRGVAQDETSGRYDGVSTSTTLLYLDLRYGLQSSLRTTVTKKADGPMEFRQGFPNRFFIPVAIETQAEQATEFLTEVVPVANKPPLLSRGFESSVATEAPSTFRCDTTSTSEVTLVPWSLLRTTTAGGYWAVDGNSRLFASQSVSDSDGTRFFNYLSEGDLAAVVPPGANGARYTRIGVLR